MSDKQTSSSAKGAKSEPKKDRFGRVIRPSLISDEKAMAGMDFDRPDRARCDFLREDMTPRHVDPKNVVLRQNQGYIIDPDQKSHLPGMVLMQCPDKIVESRKRRLAERSEIQEKGSADPDKVGPTAFEHSIR